MDIYDSNEPSVKYISLKEDDKCSVMDNIQEQSSRSDAICARVHSSRPTSRLNITTSISKNWKLITAVVVINIIITVILACVTIIAVVKVDLIHQAVSKTLLSTSSGDVSMKYGSSALKSEKSAVDENEQTTGASDRERTTVQETETVNLIATTETVTKSTSINKGQETKRPEIVAPTQPQETVTQAPTATTKSYGALDVQKLKYFAQEMKDVKGNIIFLAESFSIALFKIAAAMNSTNVNMTDTKTFKERIVFQGQVQSPASFHIENGLFPGDRIYIRATPCKTRDTNNQCRFTFYFNCIPKSNGVTDTFFVFDVRLDWGTRETIVKNSKFNGRWGSEEREHPHFPFAENKTFEIDFVLNTHKFDVLVDGTNFTAYRYRTSLELCNVNQLKLTGSMNHEGLNIVRSERLKPSGNSVYKFLKSSDQAVPMERAIPDRLLPYDRIYLRAVPSASANSFSVSFDCGPRMNNVIPFSFDVHFNTDLYNKTIVMSYHLRGDSSVGPATPVFPFKKGVIFEMLFLVKPDRFQIFVDTRHFDDFYPTIPLPTCIDTVFVDGDITLKELRFV